VALILPGVLVGAGQWLLLRRRLRLADPLVILWLIGSVIGGCAWLGILDFEDYAYTPSHAFTYGALCAGLIGGVGGAVQVLPLYGRVRWPGVWIGVSAMSSAVGWPLAEYASNRVVGTEDLTTAGYVVYGVLSGVGLLWLMRARGPGISSTDTPDVSASDK